jgi:hypothetical protein
MHRLGQTGKAPGLAAPFGLIVVALVAIGSRQHHRRRHRANVGCVAAAADPHLCYAMLAQRDGESLLELMGRLDRAIATAAETTETIDGINPPSGFKPRKQPKSRRH